MCSFNCIVDLSRSVICDSSLNSLIKVILMLFTNRPFTSNGKCFLKYIWMIRVAIHKIPCHVVTESHFAIIIEYNKNIDVSNRQIII